jgi:hypothetical protein
VEILRDYVTDRIALTVPVDEVRFNLGPAACPGINQTNADERSPLTRYLLWVKDRDALWGSQVPSR